MPPARRDKVMYPLQGRPDFQLIVVVDLRNSMATWVPSVVYSQMRSNLDEQAIELKPYFLKNGNKSNPRLTSYVVPDFSGTVCPLARDWPNGSDDLRGILYGVDGKEIMRWDKIDRHGQAAIRDPRGDPGADRCGQGARRGRGQIAGHARESQLPSLHPPMLPPAPIPASDDEARLEAIQRRRLSPRFFAATSLLTSSGDLINRLPSSPRNAVACCHRASKAFHPWPLRALPTRGPAHWHSAACELPCVVIGWPLIFLNDSATD